MRRRSAPEAAQLNASQPSRRPSKAIMGMFSRSKSVDSKLNSYQNIKGVMKFTTLDESLHSTYGSESGGERIKFKNIEIREYNRTVGDNPSVSAGPPVTIAWEYNPNTTILTVEEYEKTRPARRTQSQMILPRSVRMQMLRKEWNVTQTQIAASVRSTIRAKNQRRTTLGNLGKTDKMEEMVEGATKQLLKSLFLRKGTSQKAQELEDQLTAVDQQRKKYQVAQVMKGLDDEESESPWNVELIPDDSELDVATSSRRSISVIDETSKELRKKELDGGNPSNDGRPKLPGRKSSDQDIVDHSSNSSIATNENNEGAANQTTGESASQIAGSTTRPSKAAMKPVMKPMIVAEEPDDLLPGITALSSTVDC